MKYIFLFTLSLFINQTINSQTSNSKKVVLIGADFGIANSLGALDLFINDSIVSAKELKRIIVRPLNGDSIFIKLNYISYLKKKEYLFKFSSDDKYNYFKVRFIGYPGRPIIDRVKNQDLIELKKKKWFKKKMKKFNLYESNL